MDKEIELLKLKIQLLEKEIELEKIKKNMNVPYKAPYIGDQIPNPNDPYVRSYPYRTFTQPHSFTVCNALGTTAITN